MKKIIYNHLKPQNYYLRLFFFFTIISLILTSTLINFNYRDFDLFLLKFIVIFFLIMLISVMVEYIEKGEYNSPMEIYELEIFFQRLKDDFKLNNYDNYFLKYHPKIKKKFIKIFSKQGSYFLSSIKKDNNVYELNVINNLTFYRYFIFKFFAKKGIHKIYVRKVNKKLKIINFK